MLDSKSERRQKQSLKKENCLNLKPKWTNKKEYLKNSRTWSFSWDCNWYDPKSLKLKGLKIGKDHFFIFPTEKCSRKLRFNDCWTESKAF